ncbi:methylase [Betaproteobacteria bacterium GR16-43]|nr:methylase [Betaproteobacteria bacterium GR16-43]
MSNAPAVHWSENGEACSARWQSERAAPPPAQIQIADDRMTADAAYGLACQGIGLLWRGDFQNARQMMTALVNRADRPPRKAAAPSLKLPIESFNLARQARAQRARTLGMLLIPLGADYSIPLRRAPDIRQACLEAYGPGDAASLVSLRELLGVISAHEWRRKGIDLHGIRIHPHYGVFAPIRNEYADLVAKMPLPAVAATSSVAFDIGTGTGVLAAILARRGIKRVVATDVEPRALACARENITRLGLGASVEVVQADLFPEGKAAVVLCNPPWVPARPSSPLEYGIYDPDSRMLKGYLQGLAAHLEPRGEGWLILSDLAEHLGLRSRDELLAAFDEAGLKAVDRMDARPKHPKVSDASDPLHRARKLEVTSLWRLTPKG